MSRRRKEDPKFINSGYVSVVFLFLAAVGWLLPWHDEEPPVTKNCDAVVSNEYPAAREMLIGQGYAVRHDGSLVAPGCPR